MKRLHLLLIVLLVVLTIGCVDLIHRAKQPKIAPPASDLESSTAEGEDILTITPNPPDSIAIPKAKAIGKANMRLAVLLDKHLKHDKPNEFFSPFSISSALSMVYLGAGGDTRTELERVMGYTDSSHQVVEQYAALNKLLNDIAKDKITAIEVANSIFISKEKGFVLKPSYSDALQSGFSTEAFMMNFRKADACAKKINQWVAQKTRDKIKSIVSADGITPDLRMMLINAIYFKSDWEHKFKPESTKDDTFYTLSANKTTPKTVKMMHQTRFFHYLDLGDMQVIELPYLNSDISMYVWLPKQKGANSPSISETSLQQLQDKMKMVEVELSLPKFKANTEYDLIPPLKTMGIKKAFNPSVADFSNMANQPLYISRGIHKAFVEVDEKGTEAAAVTAFEMAGTSGFGSKPIPPIIFKVDHPFTFAIVHKSSQSILFLGKIVNP